MYFTNRRGEYLTQLGQTSTSRDQAVLVEMEMVSSQIVRFKIGESYGSNDPICNANYIGCLDGPAFLTEKTNDATLFMNAVVYSNASNRSSRRAISYYTIRGMCLSLGCSGLTAQDWNLTPDLVAEYLQPGEKRSAQFSRDGWTCWPSGLSDSELEEARNIVLHQTDSRIGNLFALRKGKRGDEGEDNALFTQFLQLAELKELLNSVLGEYHLTTFSSNALRNSDPDRRHFHVDYPYHDLDSPYPKQVLGVQVIYALDDFTVENGATIYLPGSFTRRCYPHDVDLEKTQYMTVPKGSVIVFRGDLWHSQGVNTTRNPRVALLANFSPLEVPAKDNVAEQAAGVLQIVDGKVLI